MTHPWQEQQIDRFARNIAKTDAQRAARNVSVYVRFTTEERLLSVNCETMTRERRDAPVRLWVKVVFLCLLLPLAGCAVLDPRQIDPPPPGIARIETITVDGLPERLLIRGSNPARNPVLLFVHGGPGFPAAVTRQVNSDLERDFTVVHWDQRGAGYSYFPDLPVDKMRVEQFTRETIIVARALCREFGQPKIYLLGHSWGTLPAIEAEAREPGLFYAYVGVSQLVDIDDSERRLTEAALRNAREGYGSPRDAARLRAVGPAPYTDLPTQDRAAALITALFPRVSQQATTFRLALLCLTSRYYPFPEVLRANASYRYSRRLLIPQLHGLDLRKTVPRLDVPVYFFVGRQDATFGVTIQDEYLRGLHDPAGRHFVLFDDSTHWPHLEQPAEFLTAMKRVRAQTWQPGRVSVTSKPPPSALRADTVPPQASVQVLTMARPSPTPPVARSREGSGR